MPLRSEIKFQKTLALAASASNQSEAEAAKLAARRLMAAYNIDPVLIPDRSLYSRMDFADNALLKKLRDEWLEQHPDYYYAIRRDGCTRRLRGKPRRRPVNTTTTEMFEGLFDDFAHSLDKLA